MKHYALFLVLALSAAPVFAQDAEEAALRELGVFAVYSLGNLALVDIQRGNEPVQQLKRFFSEAKLPLTSRQEKQLTDVVGDAVKALQANAGNDEAARRINVEYVKKLNETLTPDQRAELRRYRVEQIMMRGGFQALKLIMENAQVPFAEDQERKVQAVYADLSRQIGQLSKDSKGNVDRSELLKLEGDQLRKVVALLTPDQRKALMASRRGPTTQHLKP